MLHTLLTTQAYWAGTYVDLWTIPHTLFGVLVAFVVPLTASGLWVGFGLVTAGAIVWELVERITGVGNVEPITNSLTDIAVAMAGYLVAALVLAYVRHPHFRRKAFFALLALWLFCLAVGWTAYLHYGARLL